jgi:hypothetical protein
MQMQNVMNLNDFQDSNPKSNSTRHPTLSKREDGSISQFYNPGVIIGKFPYPVTSTKRGKAACANILLKIKIMI